MPMTVPRSLARVAAIAVVLAASVVGVLRPVLDNGFVLYDDPGYLTQNPGVARGLTRAGLRWALTTDHDGNWQPLTWISHMADVTLFGLEPRGHHLTSLLLHAANTGLLFLVLSRLTGAVWTAALGAALFGLHPLHVEPAAWAAERKELLAFFFGLLTLAAYRRYAVRPGPLRLAPVVGAFALGLMAKPVLVTLPFLLLLLDYWPLGRVAARAARPRDLRCLAAEKIPLFLLSAASSAVTYRVQHRGGATAMMGLPFAVRAGNALVAYGRYLGKTFWPQDLAVFYPHEGVPPAAAVAAALVLIVTGAAVALWQRETRPWLLTGWFWFLGTLVPMLGLVQVGYQSMADRYAYLPLVGLFLIPAWGLRDLVSRRPRLRWPAVAAALLVLAALSSQSRRQSTVWKDTKTLFGHALAVIDDNWLAHQNYGALLLQERELEGAMRHLQEAVRLKPDHADTWYNIGRVYLIRGEWPAAAAAFRQASGLSPGDPDALVDLGNALFNLDRFDEAAAAYERALRLQPDFK